MMLKSMRNATQRSGLMDSQAGRMYESMFDQEVSIHLAKNGSLGLAEKIKTQIQRNQGQGLPESERAFAIEAQNAGLRIRSDENTYSIDRKQGRYLLENGTRVSPSGEQK
jgi:Rod binding domain-containing protein